MLRNAVVAAVVGIILIAVPNVSAIAAYFVIDADPGAEKLFLDNANQATDSFMGKVGDPNSGPVVTITTIGDVDTGSGYANISPVADGSLTSLTFTPADGNLFGDFSTRGSLVSQGTVTIEVTDNQGHAPEVFQFFGLPANADFGRIGIVTNVPGISIKSVTVTSDGFKDLKQVDFSFVVPEPASWTLMIVAFAGFGTSLRRRRMMRT